MLFPNGHECKSVPDENGCLVGTPCWSWTYAEILQLSFPFFILITLWRIIFTKVVGASFGYRYASREFKPVLKLPKYLENDDKKKQLLHEFYSKYCKHDARTTMVRGEIKQTNDSSAINTVHSNEATKICEELAINKSQLIDYINYCENKNQIESSAHKYAEELWKSITMAFISIYGFSVMYNKPFLYDAKLQWAKFPQDFDDWLLLYYRIALGYHFHRTIYQFVDAVRPDFWAMTLHHWVTIWLIIWSWRWGLIQTGCLVMLCHDNADIFLSAGKVCRYEKKKFFTDFFFGCFIASWIGCRITLFSWKVIYSLIFETDPLYNCHIYVKIFTGLLLILLVLHFYWLNLILKVAWRAMKTGKVDDVRSDNENSSKNKKQA